MQGAVYEAEVSQLFVFCKNIVTQLVKNFNSFELCHVKVGNFYLEKRWSFASVAYLSQVDDKNVCTVCGKPPNLVGEHGFAPFQDLFSLMMKLNLVEFEVFKVTPGLYHGVAEGQKMAIQLKFRFFVFYKHIFTRAV